MVIAPKNDQSAPLTAAVNKSSKVGNYNKTGSALSYVAGLHI